MALEDDPSRKCARCRSVSQSGAGYVQHRGDFYCPLCFPKVRVDGAKWSSVRWAAIFALAFLLTRLKAPFDRVGWGLLNFYTAILLGLAVILPHELGHAISARFLRVKVFRVLVGLGPVLWKRPFLGGTLEIRRYWLGGGTICLDSRIRGFRLRHWLIIASGPLVSLILLAAILPFCERPWAGRALFRVWDPRVDLIVANLLILAINLLPRKTKSLHGAGMTDGLALLRTPFLREADVRKIVSLYYAVPAAELLRDQKYEEALRLHEEGLQEFPESTTLRHDRAVALINLRRIEEARDRFLELSKAKPIEPQLRLLCLSNIAVTDVLLERPELLEEADRTSTEAMTSLAWHPGVRATRGSVLIALGRVDEGMALVREGLDRMEDDRSRAAAACTMAIGLHKKGELAEGRKYIEMAEWLGPRSPRLPRVRELYGTETTQ